MGQMSRQFVDKSNYFELLACAAEGNKHISKLAVDMGWSQTTVGKMVAVLENRGFVNRIFVGRFRYVKLTDNGKAILERVK